MSDNVAFVKLHLIVCSILKFEAHLEEMPTVVSMMAWFERPQEDIQQAMDFIEVVRKGYSINQSQN